MSDQSESVRHSEVEHTHHLSKCIGSLLTSGDYSDVTFVVEGERLHAHKVILAIGCDYFRALLFGGLRESTQNEIHLPDASLKTFKLLLNYLYTGRLSLAGLREDTVLEILELAHQYGLERLQSALCRYLQEVLTVRNVCAVYDKAQLYRLNQLSDTCCRFIDRHAGAILRSEAFLRLSASALKEMLARDSFCAPEIEIFEAVRRWCVHITTTCSTVTDALSDVTVEDRAESASSPASFVGNAVKQDVVCNNKGPTKIQKDDQTCTTALTTSTTATKSDNCMLGSNNINDDNQDISASNEAPSSQPSIEIESPPSLLSKSDEKPRVKKAYDRDVQTETGGISDHVSLSPVIPEVSAATTLLVAKSSMESKSSTAIVQESVDSVSDRTVVSGSVTADAAAAAVAEVLEQVRFPLIGLRDLLSRVRESSLVSSDRLLDAVLQRTEMRYSDLNHRGHLLPDENVATLSYGARVVTGEQRHELLFPTGNASFMAKAAASAALRMETAPTEICLNAPPASISQSSGPARMYDNDAVFTRHNVDDLDGITVQLGGGPFIINHIRLLLWDKDSRSYSYYVETSVDGTDWRRVADYSAYLCRSLQRLYFEPRVVRFVRVVGTRNAVNNVFHLVALEAMYSSEVASGAIRLSGPSPFGLVIPTENVASVERDAFVIEGVSRARNTLIDGNCSAYDWDSGYTCHQLGSGCIVVQLAQPYIIDSMRLLLWDRDARCYSYYVETSFDNRTWTRVVDRSTRLCRSWQILEFEPLPVVFIKIVGTLNTANEVFHCVHFECPAQVRSSDEVTRAPLPGAMESGNQPSLGNAAAPSQLQQIQEQQPQRQAYNGYGSLELEAAAPGHAIPSRNQPAVGGAGAAVRANADATSQMAPGLNQPR